MPEFITLCRPVDSERWYIIGFGDVITPKVEHVEFSTFFDEMPAPKLRAYPKYTVISEKFEAMISLEMTNSRQKDFYDIWYMSQQFDFDGNILKQAIEKTFAKRKTALHWSSRNRVWQSRD